MMTVDLGRLETATSGMPHFHAAARERAGEGAGLVIRLQGFFDGEATHVTMPVIEALIKTWGGAPRVIVDAEALEYISSLGIGVLTTARVMAQQRGMTFSLECPQPAVLNVLALLGVTSYMSIQHRHAE